MHRGISFICNSAWCRWHLLNPRPTFRHSTVSRFMFYHQFTLRPRHLRPGAGCWPPGAVHLIHTPAVDLALISWTNTGTLPDKRPSVMSLRDSLTPAMCSAGLGPHVRLHTCERQREKKRKKNLVEKLEEEEDLTRCPSSPLQADVTIDQPLKQKFSEDFAPP